MSKGLKAKDKARLKLLEYLGNPDNEIPPRTFLSTEVLGYKQESTIYKIFTGDELAVIDHEALELRRKKYGAILAKVDAGLLKKAADGDQAAAKLVYQRFEGWSEKQDLKITGDLTVKIVRFTDKPENKD